MPVSYETESWPVVKARHFTKSNGRRKVRVIVIHDMEAPESSKTAENVARYFATTPTPASAHICVDSDSIVQCVMDNDVAFAAPGCNHDGIQVELAGYARQTLKEWLDPYGLQMLARAADAVAQYCLKYNIPPKRLSDAQLKEGYPGIVGHSQVSAVYRKSTHTDPGANFPWDFFMAAVRTHYEARQG